MRSDDAHNLWAWTTAVGSAVITYCWIAATGSTGKVPFVEKSTPESAALIGLILGLPLLISSLFLAWRYAESHADIRRLLRLSGPPKMDLREWDGMLTRCVVFAVPMLIMSSGVGYLTYRFLTSSVYAGETRVGSVRDFALGNTAYETTSPGTFANLTLGRKGIEVFPTLQTSILFVMLAMATGLLIAWLRAAVRAPVSLNQTAPSHNLPSPATAASGKSDSSAHTPPAGPDT